MSFLSFEFLLNLKEIFLELLLWLSFEFEGVVPGAFALNFSGFTMILNEFFIFWISFEFEGDFSRAFALTFFWIWRSFSWSFCFDFLGLYDDFKWVSYLLNFFWVWRRFFWSFCFGFLLNLKEFFLELLLWLSFELKGILSFWFEQRTFLFTVFL